MSQTCTRCSRINPPGAAYCYHDGSLLLGHARNGGAAVLGNRSFTSPFVFPSGRACHTFDELALACQEDWPAARQLLTRGNFESFLSVTGRADLALAAREGAHFPDQDRGLDQLLARLPTHVLENPRLDVHPHEVSLGVTRVGEDRHFELHLENQGMRLLYGSVTCDDCNWLTLGDAPGFSQKVFQFGAEQVLSVHVQGKRLRASPKPLEGRLIIESNGGSATVLVHADVAVEPFAEGVLLGAKSPRQIAEKAKASPKEAAECFESGAVARWYERNGWTYPITGPTIKGLAGVQQFFEALGLTPPPRVEISPTAVRLEGNVGDMVSRTLEVLCKEERPRPVYAHAASNQPWLEVSRAKLNGGTATISLVVPSVPNREGETLSAKVVVRSNGNQRFIVPVTLIVGTSFHFGGGVDGNLLAAPSKHATSPPPQAIPLAPLPLAESHGGIRPPNWLVHGLPMLLLALVLGGLLAWDAKHKEDHEDGNFAPYDGGIRWDNLIDTEPRLGISFSDTMRFGIVMLKEPDPNNANRPKRLTFEENGESNNTCIKLDGKEGLLFGIRPGEWGRDLRTGSLKKVKLKNGGGVMSVWEYPEKIRITQIVQLVPGEQTRVLDTCLVHYIIENYGDLAHTVGLRVMLDTFIGAEDGVPFVIPGRKGLLEDMHIFGQKEIPDYIQALEKPDLANPGTIAHVGLKGFRVPGVEYQDPIEKMIVCRWPDNRDARWDWDPIEPINKNLQNKDSCVVLYWAYRKMDPGEPPRHLAFTYGLNTIASENGNDSQLGLTAGGDFRPGREFTVTAYVKSPQAGQKVKLILPKGLALAEGQDMEQAIDQAGDYTQVSWRVKSDGEGDYLIEAASGLARARYRVSVRAKSLFD